MSTISNRILSIYKSRMTMIQLLNEQYYNVTDYENFSINEIDAMYANSQMDMLVSHETNQTKVYVKYYLTAKQIKPPTLDDIIEDLYQIESVLTKNDTLIIIIEDEPNETILTKVRYLFDHDGIFVVIHNLNRLQYNILKHKLVPECSVLTEDEVTALKQEYNINNLSELPEISRFDPHALALCLRPGQVIEINRKSDTALEYKYYRICV